jgi:photosystem II stability/assembly factor-like uncharacterized protein
MKPRALASALCGYGEASPSRSGSGAAGRQPAVAEAVKVEAVPTPTPALPQGTKPEIQMAEQAQRQADNVSAKMLRTVAPAAAAPPPPPQPTVAGQPARLTLNSMAAVRQTSVTSSMLSGSAVSWRFGRDGSIEKSSDRGQIWVRQSSGVSTALTDASAPSDRTCWIVGAGGVVLRTTDGVTWQQLASPTRADLVAVHAWNDLSATVTASDRSEYETADGGKTWKRRR